MSIEIKHSDTLIRYNEKDDKWEFELRGRERSAPSLAKAKEFIDKEPMEKKEKTFVPQRAFKFDSFSGMTVIRGKVTSIAEQNYRRVEVWFSADGGTRTKNYASSVYLDNEKNAPILAEIQALNKELNELKDKIDARRAALKTIASLVGEEKEN